ncbi:MAG TPA: ABC transporter permease [Terriglobia bacterium]|nr:ABC transporter permease [Terriglobia bacterium]
MNRRKRMMENLDQDIRDFIERETQDNIERGMRPEEARYAALRKFGNVTRVKEDTWGVWTLGWLEQLRRDLSYGLRQLRRAPGFTAVAVVTLALCIGANTAIFSFVDAVLLERLPYPHPEQIVMVWEKPPMGERNGISTMNFLDWKRQNTVFTAMAAETGGSMTLTGGDRPLQLQGSRVSAPFFNIWGVKPMLGRTFAPDEDQLGKNQVVVLSHRAWESRFGADPKIIGRTISLDNKPYTVIGVMPARTPFDRTQNLLWIPLAFKPKEMTRDYHWMISWARLRPGVTLQQAREQMKSIAARIAHDYPESNKGWSATVDRYQDTFVDASLRRSLWVLFAAVGAVLLIGCVNLANLLLARGASREREVAVRSALGASQRRLVRQFLTESALLSGFGGVAGLLVGYGLMKIFKPWTPLFQLPVEADVRLNGHVLLFAAAVVVATGILFGIAPAIRSARSDLVESLKEGGRTASSGMGRKQARSGLVVAEVALAFVLLSGAGLLVRSFYQLQQVDPGFESTNVITMWLPMTSAQYPNGPRIISYLDQVREKLDGVPGVLAAATTSALPLEGWSDGMPFLIEGRPFVDMANRPSAGFKQVSPSYLSSLHMRLLKGRWLAETDTAANVPVMVINKPMANRYFKGEDPIGKRILIQQIIPGQPALGPEIPWQVVGVVAEEKSDGLDSLSPGMYVSYKQSPTVNTALVVRAAMDSALLVKSIQTAIWQLNKNQAVDDIQKLDQIKSDSLGPNRLRATLLGIFAALALLLAAIGIYGVISYSVAQRTHEMGVRAALGASRWDQLRLVLGGGMALTALGLGIGVLGAIALTSLLASLLFGVSPHDPWTLTAAAVILAAVAAAACYIPASRAAKVDPMVALRHE